MASSGATAASPKSPFATEPKSPTGANNASQHVGSGTPTAAAAPADQLEAPQSTPSVGQPTATSSAKQLKKTEATLEAFVSPVKKSIGWRRHAMQRFTLGGGALGVVLAICGHPWGLALTAVGLAVGGFLQYRARGRALEQQQTKLFMAHFERLVEKHVKDGAPVDGFSEILLSGDAFKRAAKTYAFLQGDLQSDLKQAFIAPLQAFWRQVRGASGTPTQQAANEALASQGPSNAAQTLRPAPSAPGTV